MAVTNNGYKRNDLTRHPMAVTLAGVLLAGFLTLLGWLALGVSDLKAGQERLQERLSGVEQRISGVEQRLSAEIDGIRQDIAELKALVSSQPPIE